MGFLLLFLSISIKYGLASDLLDLYAPKYYPNTPHEDTQNEFTTLSLAPIDHNKTGKFKYIDVLSHLHNEKTNKAVLGHITKSGMVYAAEDSGDTKWKKREDENVDVNKIFSNSEDVAELARSKRSAIKFLRNIFHGSNLNVNNTASFKKTTSPIYLRTSHEIDINSTFTGLITNLIDAIKTLNNNLVNLKIQIIKDEGYVMVKMPFKNIENYVHDSGENSPRTKRALNESILVETNVEAKIHANDTDHTNVIEKQVPNDNKTNPQSLIITAKSEIPDDTYVINVNKTKREANATNPFETNIDVELNNDTKQVNVTVKDTIDIEDLSKKALKPTLEASFKPTELTTNNVKEKNANKSEQFIHLDKILHNSNELDINANKLQAENANNSVGVKNSKAIDVEDITLNYDDNEEILLNFIDQIYKEIKDKIQPMKDIKDKYSPQTMYKIGYIIANLDALEVTLKKLKRKLTSSKTVWEKEKLLHLFKKLNLSKYLVVNIMNYLNIYAGNQQTMKQKKKKKQHSNRSLMF